MYTKDKKPRNFGYPSRHPLYRCWASMKNRCYNENDKRNYSWYGGRGIRVCDRWVGENGFWNFVADMGERPKGCSLDRIDVNGNYEPSNCRWANAKQQALNRRTASTAIINGKKMTALEISEKTGANIDTIRRKIRKKLNNEALLIVGTNGTPKKILCVETEEIFDSIADAARRYKMKSPCSISSVLSGRAKTAYGFHWKYTDEIYETLKEVVG